MTLSRFAGVVLILAAALVAKPQVAAAQTPSPLSWWQFSAGEVLAPYDNKGKKWRAIIGPSSVFAPEYEGSDNYELMPGAVFNVRYKGRLFLTTGEGLGYDVFRGRNHRVGIAVAYDRGRDDDVDGLYGLGGIDPAPQIRLFADYVFRLPMPLSEEAMPIIFSVDLRRAIGGYDGYTGSFGLYAPIAGSREDRYFVFVGGSLMAGDTESHEAYFGITPAQSAATGYPIFRAEGGLRSMGTGLNAGLFITDKIIFSGTLGAKRLFGDIANSPVVQDPWQAQVNLTLGYLF